LVAERGDPRTGAGNGLKLCEGREGGAVALGESGLIGAVGSGFVEEALGRFETG